MLIHQSAEEVASWALSVGVSCSSIGDRCDMGESPIFNYSHWGNENLCTFCSNPNHPGWLNGNRCGAKYQIRERICPCTSTPIGTTTEPIDTGDVITTLGCTMDELEIVDYNCNPNVPDFDPQGMVCANDGTPAESYCAYDMMADGYGACARCRKSDSLSCDRPDLWCSHPGAHYEFKDCDGDGIPDPVCSDTDGHYGVIQSSNSCHISWPYGSCSSNPEICSTVDTSPQFDCGDGTLITIGYLCDGESDCANGNDEQNCDAHTCNQCQYACDNLLGGICIPTLGDDNWVQDGEADCIDGSDETTDVAVPRDVVLEYHWPTHSYLAAAWYKCKAPCGESTIGGVAVQQTYPPSELNLTPPEQCAWWCQHEPECKVAWFRWSGNDCKLYDFELSFHRQDFRKRQLDDAEELPRRRSSESTPITRS
eukprot:TRINITY_DN293_c0_g1_i3.p1 TRINITY_DN293_c0_g1~~TRINITY_DN293_c0_g1_i3.p1  ORF type:complete len:449 (+),score=79.85 TRINITY_DN293_c0_g1_i3:76-1347(+)